MAAQEKFKKLLDQFIKLLIATIGIGLAIGFVLFVKPYIINSFKADPTVIYYGLGLLFALLVVISVREKYLDLSDSVRRKLRSASLWLSAIIATSLLFAADAQFDVRCAALIIVIYAFLISRMIMHKLSLQYNRHNH